MEWRRRPRWRWLCGGWLWCGVITLFTNVYGLSDPLGYAERARLALVVIIGAALGAVVQAIWRADILGRLAAPAVVVVVFAVLLLVPAGEVRVSSVAAAAVAAWTSGTVLCEWWLRRRETAAPVERARPDQRVS